MILTVDVGNLFGWTCHGCGRLHQALVARDEEGICQVRHSSQVLVGTLRPVPVATVATVRSRGRRATRDLLCGEIGADTTQRQHQLRLNRLGGRDLPLQSTLSLIFEQNSPSSVAPQFTQLHPQLRQPRTDQQLAGNPIPRLQTFRQFPNHPCGG